MALFQCDLQNFFSELKKDILSRFIITLEIWGDAANCGYFRNI